MIINTFSIIMSIGLFTIMCTICGLFLSRTKSQHLWIIALALILCILRLIPIEVNGSYTINVWNIYPDFFSFLTKELFYSIRVQDFIFFVWLLISFFLLFKQARVLYNQIKFNQTVKRLPTDLRITQIACKAATSVHCKAPVNVYITSIYSTPIMTGFFHPIILFPESVTNLNDHEIEYILRHEIGHYLGGDIWYKLIIQILVSFLWWNPAVYLLRKSLNQLLELRSDNRACKLLNLEEKADYSDVLLKVAKCAIETPKEIVSIGFIGSFEYNYLKQRIRVLMTKPTTKKKYLSTLLITCTCFLFYFGSYTFILQPAYAPPEIENDSSMVIITPENAWLVPTDDNMYELWVNGSYYSTISSESIKLPAYSQLPLYEKE